MLLQPELVLEDVSQDHARKTVRYPNRLLDTSNMSLGLELITVRLILIALFSKFVLKLFSDRHLSPLAVHTVPPLQ